MGSLTPKLYIFDIVAEIGNLKIFLENILIIWENFRGNLYEIPNKLWIKY